MQSDTDIGCFPLPPAMRIQLKNAGFSVVEDLTELKPSELSKEAGISKEDAFAVLQLVRNVKPVSIYASATSPSSSTSSSSSSSSTSSCIAVASSLLHEGKAVQTALDMLRREKSMPAIITFCQHLDEMLGGGVPVGKITEFCGAPGVGKTQLCIQLAVDVQIPKCFGGVGGEAVYIDTEGSFIAHRVADMANAAVQHCTNIAEALQETIEEQDALSFFTLERILAGIHVFRCHDYVELLALINLLPQFIKDHTKVRLIVIDSIAFHFRHDFDDMLLRTRLLNGLAQNLIRIATLHNLAVVLTNQMTTKIGGYNRNSHLVPALGESWGHASTIRIILFWRNCQRYATLYKSPIKQEITVPYEITMSGIRTVVEDTECQIKKPSNACQNNESNPRKRLRTTEMTS